MKNTKKTESLWSRHLLGKRYSGRDLQDFFASLPKGIYCLDGPSLCGKTALLRRLEAESGRAVSRVNYEFVPEYLLRNYLPGYEDAEAKTECEIFIVEDIDLLAGKESTLEGGADLFNHLAATRTVILSGIDLRRRVPQLVVRLNSPTFFRFRKKI